jgi:hypothetical protein
MWTRFTRWIDRQWRDGLRRLVLLSGVATVAVFALLAGPPYFSTASVPQRWTFDPGLEVQTVRDAEDLRLTIGDAPSQDRETLRIKVKIDCAFIAAYLAFLVSLALVHARSGVWRKWVGYAAVLCALAVGVCDVLENIAILNVLDVPIARLTEPMLAAIRSASTAKWSLAALCAALLLVHYEPFTRSQVSDPVRSDPS